MKIEPNNIYLGDAYELIKSMEDKSVDLCIMDPPYLMETGGTGHSEIALRFRDRYRELENHKLDVGMDLGFLKELGRQYIGFEINPTFYKIAVDRVNGIDQKGQLDLLSIDYQQLDLFDIDYD